MQWCNEQLLHLGFNHSQSASDLVAPHRTIYLQLRTAINQHLVSGSLPELGVLVKPTGALNWQGPTGVENLQETSLAGDGADDEILEE